LPLPLPFTSFNTPLSNGHHVMKCNRGTVTALHVFLILVPITYGTGGGGGWLWQPREKNPLLPGIEFRLSIPADAFIMYERRACFVDVLVALVIIVWVPID
jgi:hypothetical protein